jgi:1,2-diacylglycerol 3-alpha-glucosyltransferase
MIESVDPLAATSGSKVSAAVLWLNFGPYHVARAKALTRRDELECYFLELTERESSHPWMPAVSEGGFNLWTLSGHGQNSARTAHMVRRELSRLNPDVVVSCGYGLKPMRAAAQWARRHGKGSVLTFETTRRDRSRYRVKEWLKAVIVKRYYDAAFVGGILHQGYLEELGMPASRISRPYDVVDNEYFARKAAETRTSTQRERMKRGLPEHYFLYVGRCAPEKNLARLLRAYGIYRKRHSDGWPLVVAGDGPERSELSRLAGTLNLREIVWSGFKQIDELPAYYALASCFVLPSISEPWGLVVNEAMASGLPVLVSDRCGCVPELVRPGENGFLLDPFDVEKMANVLERVARFAPSDLERMGTASRALVSSYTPDTWAKNLARTITLVARRNGTIFRPESTSVGSEPHRGSISAMHQRVAKRLA